MRVSHSQSGSANWKRRNKQRRQIQGTQRTAEYDPGEAELVHVVVTVGLTLADAVKVSEVDNDTEAEPVSETVSLDEADSAGV